MPKHSGDAAVAAEPLQIFSKVLETSVAPDPAGPSSGRTVVKSVLEFESALTREI
jgi:hypothetical protein